MLPVRVYAAALLLLTILCLVSVAGAIAVGHMARTRVLMYVQTLTVPAAPDSPGIYFIDGARDLAVRYHSAAACNAQWSPDGDSLLFTQDSAGGSTLNLLNVRGTRRFRTLLRLGTFLGSPAWSPDGQRIAFSAGARRVVQVNADGADWHSVAQIATRTAVARLSWSPSGSYLAIDTFAQSANPSAGVIWIARIGGSATPLRIAGRYAVWSPTHDTLAYFAARQGATNLYIRSVPDGSERRLTEYTTPNSRLRRPVWSPDGREITFVGEDEQITVINVHTGAIRRLNDPGQFGEIGLLRWSPDGAQLAFTADVSMFSFAPVGLYVLDVSSLRWRRAAQSGPRSTTRLCEIAWQPG